MIVGCDLLEPVRIGPGIETLTPFPHTEGHGPRRSAIRSGASSRQRCVTG